MNKPNAKQLSDAHTTLQDLKELAENFVDERGWREHQTPHNLASSIVIEAAELLEHFQWGDYSKADRQQVIDELADVLIYCVHLAHALDVDVATAFRDKLARSAQKYPVEIFNTQNNEDREAYHRIKHHYRNNEGDT